jgi:hypothetical protein
VRRGWFTTGVGLAVGALLLACSGCGGSASHGSAATRGSVATHRSAATHSGTIKYLGGASRIVTAKVPAGPAYSIVGQRYLFWGRDYLELRVHFAEPARVQEGGSSWRQGPETLEWGTQTGCEVHPFVISYGVLKATEDAVFTRISGRLVALRRASLPAALHTSGALVYGSSSRSLGGLIVETRTGKPIVDEQPGITIESPGGTCHHRTGTGTALHEFPRA